MSGNVITGPWLPGLTAATKRPGVPPVPEYLATREALGFPSFPSVITNTCPWCGAEPARACIVKATGVKLARPHEARNEGTVP